jgi:hypothetical protein
MSAHSSLLCLSENGLCSRRETVLPLFEGVSSTMGVIGVRRPSDVSYEVIRCDICGRGGSRAELSEKGLWFCVGVSWISVKASESRSLAELRRSVRCARACSSSESESESESESLSPVRLALACDTPSSEDVTE